MQINSSKRLFNSVRFWQIILLTLLTFDILMIPTASMANPNNVWKATSSLPDERVDFEVLATKGNLYVLAGRNKNSEILSSIFYSKVNDDGSLSDWNTGTSLRTPRYDFAVTHEAASIYAIGGSDGVKELPTVERADIRSNGELEDWQQLPAMLKSPSHPSAFTQYGYMFVLDGKTGEIQRSKLNQNGGLGPWTLLEKSSIPGKFHTVIVNNGFLYAFIYDLPLTSTDIEQNKIASSVSKKNMKVLRAQVFTDGHLSGWEKVIVSSDIMASSRILFKDNKLIFVNSQENESQQLIYETAIISKKGLFTNWSSRQEIYSPFPVTDMFYSNRFIYIIGAGSTGNISYAYLRSNGILGNPYTPTNISFVNWKSVSILVALLLMYYSVIFWVLRPRKSLGDNEIFSSDISSNANYYLEQLEHKLPRIISKDSYVDLGLKYKVNNALERSIQTNKSFRDRSIYFEIRQLFLNLLEILRLPSFWVSENEIAKGYAIRRLSDQECKRCAGVGIIPCSECRGASTKSALINCKKCSNTGKKYCSCTQVIKLMIPSGIHNGYIAVGSNLSNGKKIYANLFSESLQLKSRMLIIMPIILIVMSVALFEVSYIQLLKDIELFSIIHVLTIVVAFMALHTSLSYFRKSNNSWTLTLLLILGLLSLALLFLISSLSQLVLYYGFSLIYILLFIISLVIFAALSVILLSFWLSSRTRSLFSFYNVPHTLFAAELFQWYENIVHIILKRRTLIISNIFLGLIVSLLVFPVCLDRATWLLFRAATAEASGNSVLSGKLYQAAVDNAVDHGDYKQALNSQYQNWVDNVSEQNHPTTDTLYRYLDKSREIYNDNDERFINTVLGASSKLIDKRDYGAAREFRQFLDDNFPTNEQVANTIHGSIWTFVSLIEKSEPAAIKDGIQWGEDPAWQYDGDQTAYDISDDAYAYKDPAPGKKLIVLKVKLIHLGKTDKELVADLFSASGSNGEKYSCIGMKDKWRGKIPEYYDESGQKYAINTLSLSKTFEGISIGPDIVEAELVFELPQESDTYDLILKNDRMFKFNV